MISCHRQRSPNSRPWRPLPPPGRPAKTRTATAWPTCRWRSWPPEPGSLAPPCTGCSAASRACSKSLALRRRRWCAAASSTPPWTWSAGTAWPSCRWRSWPPPPGSLAPPCTGCFPARRRCSPSWSGASPPSSRSRRCWRPRATGPRPRSSPRSRTSWPRPWRATSACCCSCCSSSPAAVPAATPVPTSRRMRPTRCGPCRWWQATWPSRWQLAACAVPAGVVVTSAAEADWDQTCARLLQAAAGLAGRQDQRFAVRSSATSEDLAGASFAGQYETVLDVGLDQVPEAVRHVLDSAASARVSAYRQAHSQAAVADPSGSGMAVLVQVMVAADAAGVAFTANPVTGDRGEVVVTAVRGLGERLVAGEATGDQWVVRDGQARCTRAVEQAINADQARQVAELARRVQAYFATPQDLEWAITDTTGADVG